MNFDLFELFKTVGSLAGLVSAAFLVWDRAIRDRPRLTLARQETGLSGRAFLRITNAADDILVVRSIILSPDTLLALATDDDLRGILGATMGMNPAPIVIAEKSEKQLPFVFLEGGKLTPDRAVMIVARWRRSRRAWLWDQKSSLRVTPSLIMELEAPRGGR